MTLIASIPTVTVRQAAKADLTALGEFFEENPSAIMPAELRYQMEAPKGFDRPARLAWLDAVAGSWRVPVTSNPDGTRYCERRFGFAVVCASVAPSGSDHTADRLADLESARAARAAQLGSVA